MSADSKSKRLDIKVKKSSISNNLSASDSSIPSNVIKHTDIDVPLDWLYKGKKHKKKQSSSSDHNKNEITLNSNSNAKPPPTDNMDFGSQIKRTISASATESTSLASSSGKATPSNNNDIKPLSSIKKNPDPITVIKRNRSSSINNASMNLSKTLLKPLEPVVPPIIDNTIKRSSSMNEKPKKSLFSSLFSRRSSNNNNNNNNNTRPTLVNPNPNKLVPEEAIDSSDMSTINQEPPSPTLLPQKESFDSLPTERIVLNKNPDRKSLPIEELSKLNLKRIRFSVDSFQNDPPQQLPSRKPRQGNVLVPEEMISDIPDIALGITNTSGSSVGKKGPMFSKDSKEYKLALEHHKLALREAEIHQEEAHLAAQRIAHEVAKYKASSQNLISDTFDSFNKKHLKIEKPIHLNEHPFKEFTEGQEFQTTNLNPNEITLDVIYTRCCHLREILPIPSTLRQLKGKTAPLQTLKFLNPKPTLIDILSFCDFISVVPIHNIVFDNVSLTSLMFKIVMCSIVNTTVLEKLGLRNVVIDEYGWKLLCKFLMRNSSIVKLDISQTRTRSDLPLSSYRDAMDWKLFCQVLKLRKGNPLVELLLNGIKFHKLKVEHFYSILKAFSSNSGINQHKKINPLRLGVATSDICTTHIKCLLKWASEYHVQGMDLAFNDLSQLVTPIVEGLSSLKFNNLEYFTLSNTSITNANDATSIIRYLSKLPNIRFLDLSGLPEIFPDIFPHLHKYLPRFSNLKRIHLDNNGLRHRDISMLCTILVKCTSVSQVSMVGQNLHLPLTPINEENLSADIIEAAAKNKEFAKNTLSVTLYTFVRDSPNLTSLDLDYEDVSDEIQQRIGICLMRHMDKKMDSSFHIDELAAQDDLLYNGSLMTETAETIMTRVMNVSTQPSEQDSTKRYLFSKYVENLVKMHNNVHQMIDNLFEKKQTIDLSSQERDNLTRLILLERNLQNIMDIFSRIPALEGITIPTLPSLKHVDSEFSDHRYHSDDNHQESTNTDPQTTNESVQRPHLMATDSGRIVDVFTGKSLQDMKDNRYRDSSTSYKKRMQEEGVLHKWGFFAQQQNDIYPESKAIGNAPQPISQEVGQDTSTHRHHHSSSTKTKTTASDNNITSAPARPTRPPMAATRSGDELRTAIIKAKGQDSIDHLIHNVHANKKDLEDIYGVPLVMQNGIPATKQK